MLTTLLFTGCQSTEETTVENPMTFKAKPYTSEVIDNSELNKLPAVQVPIKEKELMASSIEPLSHRNNIVNKQEKTNDTVSPWLNKQACRDNVKVTYRVVDQNAVSGIFHAKVQVQGLIVSLDHEQKNIKIKSTGWFTTNQNLQKWQPYLKNPPVAEGILLKTGSEFWDKKDNWYLCSVN